MDYVSGEILTEETIINGYIGFEKNKIIETGKGMPPKNPICKGLIVPTFVNSHTHLGDSFIRKKNATLPNDIEKLVAPPDGIKHKMLEEASTEEIIKGIDESIIEMGKSGTSFFCDFRENGIDGINQIKTSLEHSNISSIVLSRPKRLEYDKEEIDLLLKNSEGIGLSSISDWEYSEIMKVAKHVKKNGKVFAIHASERVREDIDSILDLNPDFLVHMIKATESDISQVKENNIPIVLCPRSNAFFGLKPDFTRLKKLGIKMMIGTDNAMINPPNVLDEIRFIRETTNIFSLYDLLKMITYVPRKILNLGLGILASSSPAEFVVLDKKSLKPLYISTYK